jgi:piRNA pathway germ-plasm component
MTEETKSNAIACVGDLSMYKSRRLIRNQSHTELLVEQLSSVRSRLFVLLCATEAVRLGDNRELPPCEIAALAFTLESGERAYYHEIVDVSSVPVAYSVAQRWAKEHVHGVPSYGVPLAKSANLVWQSFMSFVQSAQQQQAENAHVIVYAKGAARHERMLQWLAAQANFDLRMEPPQWLPEIAPVEDLLDYLILRTCNTDQRSVSSTQVCAMLSLHMMTVRDAPEQRCVYHQAHLKREPKSLLSAPPKSVDPLESSTSSTSSSLSLSSPSSSSSSSSTASLTDPSLDKDRPYRCALSDVRHLLLFLRMLDSRVSTTLKK